MVRRIATFVTSRLIAETDRHPQAARTPEFSRRLAGTVPASRGSGSGPSHSPSARWRGLLLLPSLHEDAGGVGKVVRRLSAAMAARSAGREAAL